MKKTNIKDYIKRNSETATFFRENGYLYVVDKDNNGICTLSFKNKNSSIYGDYFNASDFEPYVESKLKKENVKMEEKLMTKADLEGIKLRCTSEAGRKDFTKGSIYTIKSGSLIGNDGNPWTTFIEKLKSYFTEEELVASLNEHVWGEFEIVKTKPTLSTKVNVKVDLLFDSPVEESTKDGKFIFYGRMTIFVSNEGKVGYAMVHPKELNTYNKETGQALAYWRAVGKQY